jgi:clan AA aspartic protease
LITGTVNANQEAIIRLEVRGPRGAMREIDVVLDTGFNGFVTLPHAVIAALGLPRLGRGRAILANGSEVVFDIHEATVMWDGDPRAVEADATAGMALLGMSMLAGHALWLHAVDGGRVTIQASP